MPFPRLISFPKLPWRKNNPRSIAVSQGLILEISFLVECFPACSWNSTLLIAWPLNQCSWFVQALSSTLIQMCLFSPCVPAADWLMFWESLSVSVPSRLGHGAGQDLGEPGGRRELGSPKVTLTAVSCWKGECFTLVACADCCCCCSLLPKLGAKHIFLCKLWVEPGATFDVSLAQILSIWGHLMLPS